MYHSDCDCSTGIALAANGDKIPPYNPKIWKAAVDHVHESGSYSANMLEDKPIHAAIQETNRIIAAAVQGGIADNILPEEMITSLQNDVFVFSACKNHIELKELSSMLVDDNGKIRPLSDFRQKATEIHKQYNQNYLEAEYIFATSSAQMAAKWADVERDGNRYDLQYRTAQDSKVRDAHRLLENITLPAEDPFWSSYYPPNGWRCRCNAVQVLKGKYESSDSAKSISLGEKATTEIDSKGRNRAEMFRFNPGKEKVIFPQNHPYYKVKDIPEVKKFIENETPVKPSKPEVFSIKKDVNNLNDLNDVMKDFATAYPQYFSFGFRMMLKERNKRNNGSTNGKGVIWISARRLNSIMAGINNIRKEKKTTYAQEDAFSTLHHEITHNRHKHEYRNLSTQSRREMELANEFVSRNNLSQFMKDIGGELRNKELVNKRPSTHYDPWVVNYLKLLEFTGCDRSKVHATVENHLYNSPYDKQITGLIDGIEQNAKVKLNKNEIQNMIQDVFVHSENDYGRKLEDKKQSLLNENRL